MSKAALYINAKGYAVTRHSYSGSSTFNFCARRYQLERVAGWKERARTASQEFGKILETAVLEFHKVDLAAAIMYFFNSWAAFKNDKELEYSARDGNWEDLNLSGQEFLQLYALKYPKWPFEFMPGNFQKQVSYEIFPDSRLAGIELISYIDVYARYKNGKGDPNVSPNVILDMKVSGETCPILVALDPQLRTYSFVTGVPTVGFLWFHKCGRDLKKGAEVTLLQDSGTLKAGSPAYVLSKDINDIPLSLLSVYVVAESKTLDEFDKIEGQSKVAKEARTKFILENGVPTPIAYLTRQEIEIRTAVITEDSREDMRKQIEQDVVRICSASEEDFWPMQSGVRFPNGKCPMCPMRGICLGDDKLRDELLVRDDTTF